MPWQPLVPGVDAFLRRRRLSRSDHRRWLRCGGNPFDLKELDRCAKQPRWERTSSNWSVTTRNVTHLRERVKRDFAPRESIEGVRRLLRVDWAGRMGRPGRSGRRTSSLPLGCRCEPQPLVSYSAADDGSLAAAESFPNSP